MALADEINKMILKIVESLEITSANPTHINNVIQANEMDKPDLEAMINEDRDNALVKDERTVESLSKKVQTWDNGKVGDIQRLSSQQFSNLKGFVSNPSGFIFQVFLKRFAKGAGIIALALLIFEAVKWVIGELFKPGRLWDLRFKRNIRDEIMFFRRREDQQKLKVGFSSIIITSMPRLRGSPNQAAQTINTLDFVRTGDLGPIENIGYDPMIVESSGVTTSKNKGKGRRGFAGPGR
jgi:hypothetical protein